MRCPFATYRPINVNCGLVHPASDSRHFMLDIRGFAAHSQVGYGSLYKAFSDPATQASTHFWISQKGEIEQYVDTDIQAWAHANGNPYYWSSEFEGRSYVDGPQEMDGDPLTSAQIDQGGRLVAWLHGLSSFPVVVNSTIGVSGEGLTAHRTITQGTKWVTACPGKLRLSQYPELVLSTLRHLDQTPPEEDMPGVDSAHLSDGTLVTVARGPAPAYACFIKFGRGNEAFTSLGGRLLGPPSVSIDMTDRIDVEAVGTNHDVNLTSRDPKTLKWSPWVSLGGQVA